MPYQNATANDAWWEHYFSINLCQSFDVLLNLFNGSSCICGGGYEAGQIIPSLSPTETPDCINFKDFKVVESGTVYTCTWYGEETVDYIDDNSRCTLFGNDVGTDGRTPNEACCVCGGVSKYFIFCLLSRYELVLIFVRFPHFLEHVRVPTTLCHQLFPHPHPRPLCPIFHQLYQPYLLPRWHHVRISLVGWQMMDITAVGMKELSQTMILITEKTVHGAPYMGGIYTRIWAIMRSKHV